MAKVKVNQSNQPEHSSPLASGKPKTTDSTVSNCFCVYSVHRFCGVKLAGQDGHARARLALHAISIISAILNHPDTQPFPLGLNNNFKTKTKV